MFERYKEDIAAFRATDPAATSTLSIVLNSPGMRAVWAYRRQHWLWTHGYKLLARTLSTRTRKKFGVEIHPGATIGRRFLIDHGMGIVIGETTIIGDDCKLYQGVTLGGTGKQTGKRHPTLKDHVVVGVGASVLGDITLGNNVKVGGGAVVVHDVPDDCTVVGIPGHITTYAGKRIKSDEDKNIYKDICRAQNASAAVEKHEDEKHQAYLPDPVTDEQEEISAQIAELNTRLRELECRLDETGMNSAHKS